MATIPGGADLVDEALHAVVHLTGDGAEPMLAAAAGAVGAGLGSVVITQVDHEPGSSCTVTYAAELLWPDGHRSAETLVAATTRQGPPEGAAVLSAGGLQVGIWRHPFDPALPGLADATHPDRLAVRLGHVGPGPWRGEVVSYRPGRRAVVRACSDSRTVFVKLVRPARAAALASRHQLLHAAGLPVPELLAADLAAGFLVLDQLPGEPLRDVLLQPPTTVPTLDAEAVVGLAEVLRALGGVELDGRPSRRRPLADVTAHAHTLAAVLPDQAARVHHLVDELRVDDAGDPLAIGADVTVHGDLHDAQLMVDASGRVCGLLDLDDAGRGARADDLGNLWGHATTMSLLAPGAATRAWCASARRLVELSGCDPNEVARRAAAVTLSMATGPFRVREAGWEQATRDRIAAAEQLLGPVREVSEHLHGDLIAVDEN